MRLLLGLSALLLLARCATPSYQPQAREVKRRPTQGGTIALGSSYRPEDRVHAEIVMKSNCGNQDVKIVEEGEVIVGEQTQATTDKNARVTTHAFTIGGLPFGNDKPAERTTTQTVQIKEWHISYDCIASASSGSSIVKSYKKSKK